MKNFSTIFGIWAVIMILLPGQILHAQKALVCLTYDDGIISQLDQAIPDLEDAGFRGTFYLTGQNLHPEFIERWREVAEHGHELGCHSLFHPCSGDFDWVPEEYETEDYTIRRILDEASLMNQFLYAIDGRSKRSYAYPCYEKVVGGVSYVDTLSKSGLFMGARGGDPRQGQADYAENLNLFDIPSLSITDEVPFEEVLAYIGQAVKNRSIAVFCFHGVGGDYILTSREYHQKIISYLAENEDKIQVLPLVEAATFLSGAESR